MIKLRKELNTLVIAFVLLLSCSLVAQATFSESYSLNIGVARSTFVFQFGDWKHASSSVQSDVLGRVKNLANSSENQYFLINVLRGTFYFDLNNGANCTVADLSLIISIDNKKPSLGDSVTDTIANDGSSTVVQDIILTDFIYSHIPVNCSTDQGVVTFNIGTRALDWNLGAYVIASGGLRSINNTVAVDICGKYKDQVEIINNILSDSDSMLNNA